MRSRTRPRADAGSVSASRWQFALFVYYIKLNYAKVEEGRWNTPCSEVVKKRSRDKCKEPVTPRRQFIAEILAFDLPNPPGPAAVRATPTKVAENIDVHEVEIPAPQTWTLESNCNDSQPSPVAARVTATPEKVAHSFEVLVNRTSTPSKKSLKSFFSEFQASPGSSVQGVTPTKVKRNVKVHHREVSQPETALESSITESHPSTCSSAVTVTPTKLAQKIEVHNIKFLGTLESNNSGKVIATPEKVAHSFEVHDVEERVKSVKKSLKSFFSEFQASPGSTVQGVTPTEDKLNVQVCNSDVSKTERALEPSTTESQPSTGSTAVTVTPTKLAQKIEVLDIKYPGTLESNNSKYQSFSSAGKVIATPERIAHSFEVHDLDERVKSVKKSLKSIFSEFQASPMDVCDIPIPEPNNSLEPDLESNFSWPSSPQRNPSHDFESLEWSDVEGLQELTPNAWRKETGYDSDVSAKYYKWACEQYEKEQAEQQSKEKKDDNVLPENDNEGSTSADEEAKAEPKVCQCSCTCGANASQSKGLYRPLSYAYIVAKSDAEFRRLTGLSKNNFLAVYKFVGGDDMFSKLKYQYNPSTPTKRTKKMGPNSLTYHDRLLITLMRLRRGFSTEDLALFFNVSSSLIGDIFYVVIQLLYSQFQRLKEAMFTTRADQPVDVLPACLKPFKNYRATIDTTEVKIQVPYNYKQQGNTFSKYKGANVVNYLIACNCWGAVSFVSPGFEGNISDVELFKVSGICDHLHPNDLLLVDRGFTVEQLTDPLGVKLVHPAFLGDRQVFSKEEDLMNKKISAGRIHIERCIRRMKCFQLMKRVTNNMLPELDQIVFVIGCLVNFDPPNMQSLWEDAV